MQGSVPRDLVLQTTASTPEPVLGAPALWSGPGRTALERVKAIRNPEFNMGLDDGKETPGLNLIRSSQLVT